MNQEKCDQNKTRKKEWIVEPQLDEVNLIEILFLNCRKSVIKLKPGKKNEM